MLRVPGWRRLALTAPLLLAFVVPACTSPPPSPPSPSGTRQVTVMAQPGTSSADQAVHIEVAGLGAGQQATVRVSSTDANGVPWVSAATYRADASGVVDPSLVAPLSGSYQGVSGMGLVWSMHQLGPVSPRSAGGYIWNQNGTFPFTVTVRADGATVARTSFGRRLAAARWSTRQETLAADGFVGYLGQPDAGPRRRAAVLLIGGSEGGLPLPLTVALLAGQGYLALGVAYFGLPGLPSALAGIPLEYFARALRWLARQPGVDPARIAVLGVSRGSEAAQLLGVHYPGLVHAVIASVPNDAAACSYPRCRTAAWMLDGKPLPYTREFDNPAPTDNPAAVIPDERIDGPVFLDCGEADQVWTSCPYARAILSRLDRHHDRWTHVLYAYPGAGHVIGDFAPYEPLGPKALAQAAPSVRAFQEAEPGLVQHLLGFLAAFAGRPAGQ
jgi:dienelactone hydrolase